MKNKNLLIFLNVYLFIFTLNAQDMIPQGTKISEQEFKELLKNFGGKRYVKKAERIFSALEVYGLNDYRVIAVKDKNEIILYSKEEKRYFDDINDKPFKDPITQEFLKKVGEYSKQLPQMLGVDEKLFDKSMESLDLVDSLLAKLEDADELDEAPLFYPLIAYCGEVVIHQTNGIWELKKVGKGTQLYIKMPNKKEVKIFEIIKHELINGIHRYHLIASIRSEMGFIPSLKGGTPRIVNPNKN